MDPPSAGDPSTPRGVVEPDGARRRDRGANGWPRSARQRRRPSRHRPGAIPRARATWWCRVHRVSSFRRSKTRHECLASVAAVRSVDAGRLRSLLESAGGHDTMTSSPPADALETKGNLLDAVDALTEANRS